MASSPCTLGCSATIETPVCLTCYRSLADVIAWGSIDEPERKRRMAARQRTIQVTFDTYFEVMDSSLPEQRWAEIIGRGTPPETPEEAWLKLLQSGASKLGVPDAYGVRVRGDFHQDSLRSLFLAWKQDLVAAQSEALAAQIA